MNAQPKFGFSEFTTWPWSFGKDIAEYPNTGDAYRNLRV